MFIFTLPTAPDCQDWGQHIGKFCRDREAFQAPVPLFVSKSGMLPIYHNFAAVPILIAIFFALRPIAKRLLVDQAFDPTEAIPDDAETFWVTFWLSSFVVVCIVWFWTVFIESSQLGAAVRIGLALIVLPSIFALEALALAVLELEDKELPDDSEVNSSNAQAVKIMSDYRLDADAYIRAREWLLASLIILLTTLVEYETYHIPLVGTYNGPVARTVMTGILATVTVIWMAQSPGKELGKKRPFGFLSLWFAPKIVHIGVLKVAGFLSRCSADRPSQVTAGYIDRLLPFSSEPQLAPAGSRLFADLIRRYGHGDCEIHELFDINEDGSVDFKTEEIVYVGPGKVVPYFRLLLCDVDFLEMPKIQSVSAFKVREMSANIEYDLAAWKTSKGILEEIPRNEINTQVGYFDGNRKSAAVHIDVGKSVLKQNEAYLICVTITSHMEKGAFKCAEKPGRDSWSRKLLKPCYLAVTTYRLLPDSKAHFRMSDFKVLQEEHRKPVAHERETNRFLQLQLAQDREARDAGVPCYHGISKEDGKTLRVKLRQGLPGAEYKVSWEVTLKERQRGASV
jgi:hypothetical protein